MASGVSVHLVESEGNLDKLGRKSVEGLLRDLSKTEGGCQHSGKDACKRVVHLPSTCLSVICSSGLTLPIPPQQAFPDPRTTLVMLCNHHCSLVPDIFITPK